ncbi:uncharacterized protein LOC120836604 [Ixodes scapularis]|uniref:uncharacterized protein LOC120836604 n=1 Tax=Ixodes scapularis TaxID=6945 RepID=UPI001A9E5CBB|nr:uncharacterized protein LOC120836604 [Ixodes scapularis]
MDTEKLMKVGQELGLSGAALKQWMDEERVRERDQRTAEREATKEAEALARARLDADDHTRARLEAERAVLELQLRLQERRESAVEGIPNESGAGTPAGFVQGYRSPHKLIPVFNEKRDELDAYIQRFERVATCQEWPQDKWALSLSLCLTGEALSVVGRMAADAATNYTVLKQTLLQRFRYTEEGYRAKFREARPEEAETGRQFTGRLLGYFDHWQEMAKTERTYDALRDKIVSEQFLKRCHEKLTIFLRERGCQGLDKLAEAADHYLEAQGLVHLGRTNKDQEAQLLGKAKISKPPDATGRPACFLCNKQGHRAADCWSKSRGSNPKLTVCWKCRKTGHKAESCPNKTDAGGQASCSLAPQNEPGKVGLDSHSLKRNVKAEEDERGIDVQTDGMPTAEGLLERHPVIVLRDSGCNSVIVKRSLVPDDKLTGRSRSIYLLDRTVRCLPEAEVDIDSPYFTGTVRATCMERPLYDVVLGNIDGVRDASAPDVKWTADQKFLPLQEKPQEKDEILGNQRIWTGTTLSPSSGEQKGELQASVVTMRTSATTAGLPVAEINPLDINPAELSAKQKQDATLQKCFEAVGSKVASRSADIDFVLMNGILFRRYRLPSQKEMEQLVVPTGLRTFVLKMAHEGILSGHQGIKRTTDRVLEEFYWPGVQGDVTWFVKSCDICQRTVPKHLVGRVPLKNMPVIETPFQRVAIDIVGPLSPTSEKGNRYVLTMVDYSTRYPDAVALPSIETERIAEALLEMFSRVGFPREIISDRGKSFTSGLMKEFSRLLSFKQMPTTPYHPMANGLVERFNGTLKQMIRRMCQESPKRWDRYLAPLLFAYREVPQASVGFAPFDLLYGRYVRGPMAILKEIWTGEHLDENTKTSYGYMVELRQRLEDTCRIAQEQLRKAKIVQKKLYDKKTRVRHLAVGDKVLLLLPSENNKLILTWKGPFKVLERRNDIDYVIDLGTRSSLFHINMLKKYEERPVSNQPPQHASVAVQHEEVEEEDIPSVTLHKKETHQDVKVSNDLTASQQAQVSILLAAHKESFTDVPGKTCLVECKLKTTTDIPIRVQQYPIPFAIQEAQYVFCHRDDCIVRQPHKRFRCVVKKYGQLRVTDGVDVQRLHNLHSTLHRVLRWTGRRPLLSVYSLQISP